LCLDTGWAIDGKQDPVALAKKYRDRLYGVHFKDFVYQRVRKPVDVIIGEGLLDLPAFLAVLKELDYSEPISFEYEGDPGNPIPAVRKCVEAVQKAAGV
jgi:sugar phosphate isomerase/epimerase